MQDTSKFKFPLELDMAPYCDSSLRPEEAHYELFSVVIHRGSTHSGHYSTYIRDIDDLGVWQVRLRGGVRVRGRVLVHLHMRH